MTRRRARADVGKGAGGNSPALVSDRASTVRERPEVKVDQSEGEATRTRRHAGERKRWRVV